MPTNLPEPIPVPWTMKPVESAETRIEVLDDGRLALSIRHDVIHGVTPAMLVWWFGHMDGDMEVEGQRYPKYRVWHPRDHVGHAYVRRAVDGSVGPGSVFRIHEVLGRNPAFEVDVLTNVTRLDDGGFSHRPRPFGLPLVRMDYSFTRVPGGTSYENGLTFGVPGRGVVGSALARPVNRLLRAAAFPEAKARAWLKHNVEEVGNFEFFLPDLYSAEHGAPSKKIPTEGLRVHT
jgi:hypothetical protein